MLSLKLYRAMLEVRSRDGIAEPAERYGVMSTSLPGNTDALNTY